MLSPASGFVEAIQCEQVGIASLVLAADARRKKTRLIPRSARLAQEVGDPIQKGEPFCTIHYNSAARLGSAQSLLQQAYRIAEKPPVVDVH